VVEGFSCEDAGLRVHGAQQGARFDGLGNRVPRLGFRVCADACDSIGPHFLRDRHHRDLKSWSAGFVGSRGASRDLPVRCVEFALSPESMCVNGISLTLQPKPYPETRDP